MHEICICKGKMKNFFGRLLEEKSLRQKQAGLKPGTTLGKGAGLKTGHYKSQTYDCHLG